MHLQDAHLAGLAHDRDPHLGGKLLVDALELNRVRAIGTLQRATMRQLGEQADWRACAKRRGRVLVPDHALGRLIVHGERLAMSVSLKLLAHPFMYPLSARPWSRSITSALITSFGAEYSWAKASTISSTVRLPSQSLSTATAVWSGVRTRSGASKIQRPRPASWRSLR